MTNIRKMLNNNYLESEVCMKRKMYESPLTLRTEVELEGYFCASADIQNPNDAVTGKIEEHEINKDFNFTFDSGQDWTTIKEEQ